MKRRMHYGLPVVMSIACSLLFTVPAFASNVKGKVETVGDTEISGWAWDSGSPEAAADVELYIYIDGAEKAEKLADVKADQYRDDLEKQLGYGNHGFSYEVNWNEIKGHSFVIEAYVVSGQNRELLTSDMKYEKPESGVVNTYKKMAGPGGEESINALTTGEDVTKGEDMGTFSVTAYCGCSKCSSGRGITYAGTAPQAGHTISADLNLFPLGTRLKVGDIIYTVEDKGRSVEGKELDIYFASHEEALNFGRQEAEVFLVE